MNSDHQLEAPTIHERFKIKFMSFWLQNYHEFEYCADELSYDEFEYAKFFLFKLKFMNTGRIHAERCYTLNTVL